MEDKTKPFLEELTALSKKHGLIIWGCGCCASPSIEELESEEKEGYSYSTEGTFCGKLEWIKDKNNG
jgi:hypothetical protein